MDEEHPKHTSKMLPEPDRNAAFSLWRFGCLVGSQSAIAQRHLQLWNLGRTVDQYRYGTCQKHPKANYNTCGHSMTYLRRELRGGGVRRGPLSIHRVFLLKWSKVRTSTCISKSCIRLSAAAPWYRTTPCQAKRRNRPPKPTWLSELSRVRDGYDEGSPTISVSAGLRSFLKAHLPRISLDGRITFGRAR